MKNDKVTTRLKQLVDRMFGISEWKLNEEGKLDVDDKTLQAIKSTYGEEFLAQFEKLLANGVENDEEAGEESAETNQKKQYTMKLELLCALLALGEIALSEEGNATLSKEQLEAIEAGLRKLTDEKTAAEQSLSTAEAGKTAAEQAMQTVITDLEDLGEGVKAAEEPKAKVEAVRLILAKKPGQNSTGKQEEEDATKKVIEGADPASEEVKKYL